MPNRKPCAALFMTPVIQWNGDVTTCCYDPLMELKVGNINEQSIDEIWYSEEMQKRRILQIIGDFSYPKKCLTCKNVDGIQITHKEVIEYLKNIDRQDLIPLYKRLHGLPQENKVIRLDPILDIKNKNWDVTHNIYTGQDKARQGYCFILGSNTGFFEYVSKIKPWPNVKRLLIVAHLAAFPWDPKGNKMLYKDGFVELYLNSYSLGKHRIYPLRKGHGRIYTWVVASQALLNNLFSHKQVKLKFCSKGTGLAILGRPLDYKEKYVPLTLFFDTTSMQLTQPKDVLRQKIYFYLGAPSYAFEARFWLAKSQLGVKQEREDLMLLAQKIDSNAPMNIIDPEQDLVCQNWSVEFNTYLGEINQGGYSFILGRGKGYFAYTAQLSNKPQFLTISAHLATLLDNPEQKLKKVELYVNNIPLGTKKILPLENGHGRIYTWKLEDQDTLARLTKSLSIKFVALDNSSAALCVLGKPVCLKQCYFPIILRTSYPNLKQKAQQHLKFPPNHKICSALWKSPTINWNGDVTVCCKDDHMQLKAGNILKQDFNQLWWDNPELNLYRLKHIEGKLSTVPLCSYCRFKDDITIDKMPVEDIKTYLEFLLGKEPPNYKDSFVTIEVTNKCNMECIMCPQAHGSYWRFAQDSFGFMKLDDFKKIINKLEGQHFRDIVLFWFGEPLLHPDFKEIIKHLAKKQFYERIIIHTNALLLDKATIELLTKLNKLLMIHFSLDAATKETYEKIRKRGNFEVAIRNIKQFLLAKKGKPNITAVLQFIVMDENKHELLTFRDYWAEFFKHHKMKYTIATMKQFDDKYTNFIFYRKLANQSFIVGKGFKEVTDSFYEEQIKRLK